MPFVERCPAWTLLDAAQVAWLAGLPGAKRRVPVDRYCELEAGHRGSHASLGQLRGERGWWILWRESAIPTIERLEPCPGDGEQPLDRDEVCLLFKGHPGCHTFEM